MNLDNPQFEKSQQLVKQITEMSAGMLVDTPANNLIDKYYHLIDIDVDFEADEITEFRSILSNTKMDHQVEDIFKGVPDENSCFIFSKKNKFRRLCAYLGSHHYFETIVITVIILSSLKLVIETYETEYWSNSTLNIFLGFDYVFNGLFIIEATIKIVWLGFVIMEKSYLRDSWSQLDFFIVACSIIDMSFTNVQITIIKVLR